MRTSQILQEIEQAGVIRARDLPGASRGLSRLAARGLVVRMLPGIYAAAALVDNFEARCAALMLWDPDAVIAGRAAARLTWWPEARVDVIEFHSRVKKSVPRGYRLHRSGVPDQDILERRGLRVTRVAWTVVHLARVDDGEAIDESFRRTRVGLEELWKAFSRSARRWGNRLRRLLLVESRDRPWSQAERRLHRLLRELGIHGWVTNHPIMLNGQRRFLDLAFTGRKIVLEVDGRSAHGPDQFESDRERQNALVAAGWRVLRVTWRMLDRPGELIAQLKTLLRRSYSAVV